MGSDTTFVALMVSSSLAVGLAAGAALGAWSAAPAKPRLAPVDQMVAQSERELSYCRSTAAYDDDCGTVNERTVWVRAARDEIKAKEAE